MRRDEPRPSPPREEEEEELFVLLPDEAFAEVPPAPRAPVESARARVATGTAAATAVRTRPDRSSAPRGAALSLPLARDDEELLASVAAEIDREVAGELWARRWISPKRLAIAALVLLPIVLPAILIVGWPYYSLPIAERVFHTFHPALRSSGWIGLTLGIVGLATMLASLGYVVRKRLVARRGSRGLQGWLRFHIAAGVIGPLFAITHAGFVPTSAMGLFATISLAVVVTSGFLGRYLLAYVPRESASGEPALDEVRRRLAVYKRRLMALGIRTAHLDIESPGGSAREPGVIVSFLRVLLGDRTARLQVRRLRVAVIERGLPAAEVESILVLGARLCRERQWLMRSREFRRLVVAWRLFHRWFAIVLFSAIGFHIWVALRFGWGN